MEIKCGTAIYKGKGDPIECGSYRGIKLLEHALTVVERIFEYRIQQQIEIDDIALVLQQNRLRWYGHVLEKKRMIGRINVWSMKLKVQDQEEDQRGPGERLYERTVNHVK